jgi:surface polysaccharide O-acyltransferase-like enzyme
MGSIQTTQKTHIFYLDFIKLLAAFMVAFYHIARLRYGFVSGVSYVPNANGVLMNICVACVPLFFMVNGAAMLAKPRNFESVYVKAAKIALILVLAKFIVFPSWFFKTLIVIYLLFPLLQWLYNRPKRYLMWLFIGVAFALSFLPNLLSLVIYGFDLNFSFSLKIYHYTIIELPALSHTGFFRAYSIVLFFAGAFISKKKIHWTAGLLLFAAGLCYTTLDGIVFTNQNNEMFDTVNGAFPTLGGLLTAFGVFIMAKALEKPNIRLFKSIITFFAGNVLMMYLLHLQIKFILMKYFLFKYGSFLIYMAVTIGILLICTAVSVVVKKIPFVKWVFET